MSSRILMIDDEEAILTLLYTVFKKEGFENVKTVNDSITSIEVCREYNPDIIILDIMMPKKNGFEVMKEIRKFSIAPVLLLSAKSEETDKLLGLGLGADDYITKPFSTKEVVYRVKAHLRRIERIKNSLNPNKNIIKTKDFTINFNEGKIERNGRDYILRAKELRLLKLLINNANIIITKEQIVQKVWDDVYIGYENTLMVHIRRLRQKLEEIPSSPKYLITVKGIGYKFQIDINCLDKDEY